MVSSAKAYLKFTWVTKTITLQKLTSKTSLWQWILCPEQCLATLHTRLQCWGDLIYWECSENHKHFCIFQLRTCRNCGCCGFDLVRYVGFYNQNHNTEWHLRGGASSAENTFNVTEHPKTTLPFFKLLKPHTKIDGCERFLRPVLTFNHVDLFYI